MHRNARVRPTEYVLHATEQLYGTPGTLTGPMGALSTHNTGTLGTCMVPSELTWPAHWSLHRTTAILAQLAGMAAPGHR
jgi:hypothetical protein